MKICGCTLSIRWSAVVPVFGEPTMKKSGARVSCAGNACTRRPRSAWRHPQRAVEPDRLAVEHAVLHDVAGELGVLRRLAEALRIGGARTELLTSLPRPRRQQRRVEQARRDRVHADAVLGE